MAAEVIGRREELGCIEDFLERLDQGPAALILAGEPGIGKTILWEAGVEAVARRSVRVLSCRCIESEASFSFAGLTDLVGAELESVATQLAPPRRRALEVALLIAGADDEPVSPRAIGMAFLDVLRELSRTAPVVIAVDDLQWLDSSSAMVLQMALRRLSDESVGLLATVRDGRDIGGLSQLERSFPEERQSRLLLQPLSLGALHRLLRERLGLELSRPELVRLADATSGNPFFVLEIGRELARTGLRLHPGKPLPLPSSLDVLLDQRLGRLAPETREVLLTVAALSRPKVEVVAAAQTETRRALDALEVATREDVIQLDGSRIRFTHPLLARACYEGAPTWRRQEIHARLATLVQDDEERVRHLALATAGADAELAADLESAAVAAEARGTIAAAELFDLAAELTPREHAREWRRRRMEAALMYSNAGDPEHGAEILEGLLPVVPPGAERADVLGLLAHWHTRDLKAGLERFDQALLEADGDAHRTARLLSSRGSMQLSFDLRRGLVDARRAFEIAESIPQTPTSARPRRIGLLEASGVLTAAIARLAYLETSTLGVTPGLLERGVELEAARTAGSHATYFDSPAVVTAHRMLFRDELDSARTILEAKEAKLTSEASRVWVHVHLATLEWLSGRWSRALEHGIEAIELSEQTQGVGRGSALQVTALVEAHLGRVGEAQRKAEDALAHSRSVSSEIDAVESLGVLGHLQLALGDYQAAEGFLGDLPARLIELGWEDPSSPVWPDAIEALLSCGDLSRARTYVGEYEQRARRASARSRACAARCRGLLTAAEGDFGAAIEALDRSRADLESLPYPFERARTLLALGQVGRRARQRRAAREALEAALAIFEDLEARLWVERARSELRRISGRRAAYDELTEAEGRVARLAAEGLSNKEIAAAEFVSVRTVEARLYRIYRKLGVHSRSALARRLVAGEIPKVQ